MSMDSFDAAAVAMRGAAFVAQLQAAGLAFFIAVHRKSLANGASSLLPLARAMTLAGLALVLMHQMLEGARLAGEWSGIVDPAIQSGNWRRSPGLSALVGAAGLATEFVGLCLQRVAARMLPVLGACAVVASFALTGHTTGASAAPWLGLLLALHVTI